MLCQMGFGDFAVRAEKLPEYTFLILRLIFKDCDLNHYNLGILSILPNASRRCAVANEQCETSRESMDTLSRPTDRVHNTTLFLLGG
jgi:hypothetical protein